VPQTWTGFWTTLKKFGQEFYRNSAAKLRRDFKVARNIGEILRRDSLRWWAQDSAPPSLASVECYRTARGAKASFAFLKVPHADFPFIAKISLRVWLFSLFC